jgi:hypothetical protein
MAAPVLLLFLLLLILIRLFVDLSFVRSCLAGGDGGVAGSFKDGVFSFQSWSMACLVLLLLGETNY